MSIDRIFRVRARRLNLREQPGTDARVLVTLDEGQAVARLDDVNRGGWWYVFADTPGEGIYVGHVWSEYLTPAFGAELVTGHVVRPPPVPAPPGEADALATDEEADSPERETDGETSVIIDSDEDEPQSSGLPTRIVWPDGWNPAIPPARRHASDNQGKRTGTGCIDRIILHITGTKDFDTVVGRFTAKAGGASAHYLVMPDGLIHQFVPENLRAFHSGINRTVRALYQRQDGTWRQYKRYFSWHKGYPADAIFVDSRFAVVPPSRRAKEAVLVMPGHRGEWPDYAYFDRRWGRVPLPVGFTSDQHDPNNNSIGIEIFSIGARKPLAQEYTAEMYAALGLLVGDLCRRHSLPISRDTVCGHEDVNPVERWGWDPNQGFDWERLFELARQTDTPVA